MNQEWFTAPELAKMDLPGLSSEPRSVRRLAERDDWGRKPSAFGGPSAKQRDGSKAIEYHFSVLPPSAWRELAQRGFFELPALSCEEIDSEGVAANENTDLWEAYSSKSTAQKARAESRLKAIQLYTSLKRENKFNSTQAKRAVVAKLKPEMKISTGSLSNWLKAVRGATEDKWLPLLIESGKGRKRTEVHPDDWAYMKGLYLKQTQPPISACFEKMVAHAEAHGRTVSVTLRTVTNWINQIPQDVVILMRQGPEAARLSKPSQKRSVAHLEAMEHLNADGHVWDFRVEWEDGSVGRPTFAVLQDVYSRKILSWRMAKTESSEIVRLAIRDTFETYGLPKCMTFDNGSGWTNKHLTAHSADFRYRGKVTAKDSPGLLALLGVKTRFARPARGQSKPIERAFLDMENYMRAEPICDGAWVGNSTEEKPENYGTKAVPYATFHKLAEQVIDAHNARVGRNTEMGKGKHSFDQVFYESLKSGRSTVRKAHTTMLDLFLLSRIERTVNARNASVTVAGTEYWNRKLGNYRKQKVTVLFNPENLSAPVTIQDIDGRKICEAEPQGTVKFDSIGQASAQRAKDNAYARHVKALQDAENIMSLPELIKRSPIKGGAAEPDIDQPNVIQGPFRGRTAEPELQPAATGTDGQMTNAEYLSNVLEGLRKKARSTDA